MRKGEECHCATFSSYLALLVWRSNIHNLPHSPTSFISKQHYYFYPWKVLTIHPLHGQTVSNQYSESRFKVRTVKWVSRNFRQVIVWIFGFLMFWNGREENLDIYYFSSSKSLLRQRERRDATFKPLGFSKYFLLSSCQQCYKMPSEKNGEESLKSLLQYE